MSPEGQELVRCSWALLAGRHEKLEATFHARLCEVDPELEALVRGARQRGEAASPAAIVDSVVRVIDDAGALMFIAARLGPRVGVFGIGRRELEVTGAALVWTLEHELGARLTSDARRAWRELLALLGAAMGRSANTDGLVAPPSHRSHGICGDR